MPQRSSGRLRVRDVHIMANAVFKEVGEGVVYHVLSGEAVDIENFPLGAYKKFQLTEQELFLPMKVQEADGSLGNPRRRPISESAEDLIQKLQVDKEGLDGRIVAYVTDVDLGKTVEDDYGLRTIESLCMGGARVYGQLLQEVPEEDSEIPIYIPPRESLHADQGDNWRAFHAATKKGRK